MLLAVLLTGCVSTPYDTRPSEGLPPRVNENIGERDKTKEWWPFPRW